MLTKPSKSLVLFHHIYRGPGQLRPGTICHHHHRRSVQPPDSREIERPIGLR